MKRIINFLLLLPYNIFRDLVWLVELFIKPISVAKKASYFPEKNRKSFINRYFDSFSWKLKYGDFNEFYNLYGLDCVGSNPANYISENRFWLTASTNNRLVPGNKYCLTDSQIYYLRDKFAFYQFMKSHNLPVPEVFCLINGGKLYDSNLNEIVVSVLKDKKDFFVKDFNGQCASFVKHIKSFDDLKKYPEIFEKNGGYILQEAVHQSSEMSRINPNSINVNFQTFYN